MSYETKPRIYWACAVSGFGTLRCWICEGPSGGYAWVVGSGESPQTAYQAWLVQGADRMEP